MKKLTAAVVVALLASVAASMAQTQTEYTPVAVVPLDFKGTTYGLDGKKLASVDTSNISTTGLFWARIRGIEYDNVGTTNVVAVETNEFNVLANQITQTNLVSIGGGTNVIVVIQNWSSVLGEDASVLTSKGKLTADYYGSAPTGNTNNPTATRDVMITGSVKQDKKNPTVPKVNAKVQGIWLDGIATVKGNIKNAK